MKFYLKDQGVDNDDPVAMSGNTELTKLGSTISFCSIT